MICSTCGTNFPDGQMACPTCGQPVQNAGGAQPMGGYQQPVQPMSQPVQPMGGYQQANQQAMGTGMGAFINALKADVMKIVGLVGGVLIFLSPFFTWFKASVTYWGTTSSQSENMFTLGKKYSDVRIYYIWTIILLFIGFCYIIWDMADYLPKYAQWKANMTKVPFMDLILAGVGLLVVILALCNGTVNDVIDQFEALGGKGSHSIGPVVAIIGLVLAAVPRVLKLVKK